MRNAYAVLLVPAPPPPVAPAPSQPAPVVIGPLWNPKAEAPPPRQAPQHELTHTVQQQESRQAQSVGNVLKSRQDAGKSSIDNAR